MSVYTTGFLVKVIANLIRPSTFFLDRYFRQEQLQETEEIHFDLINKKRRLAPFVSPLVAGKIVQELGKTTNTFKPAYLKPKTPLAASGALKRAVGEQIGGAMSAADRQLGRISSTLMDHVEQIDRRMEWMAVQSILNGSVTVSGDDYQTSVVDFQRDAALTITLAGTDLWNDPLSKPLDDLQDWSLLMLQKSGAPIVDVFLEIDGWKAFRSHADVEKRLDTRNVKDSVIMMGGPVDIGATFMGVVDGFNIWTYVEWFEDDAGVEQPMLASGEVLLGSAAIEGVRAHGAINDVESGLQALAYFPKHKREWDPSADIILTQSAPLPVPTRANASAKAQVL